MNRSKEEARKQNRAYYARHCEAMQARASAYRTTNHEKVLARLSSWRAKNPEYALAYNKAYYQKNREKLKANQQVYNRARREAVLQHYGNGCACCGEPHYEFLAVDHINGGGKKHLSQIGQRIVDYLAKHSYPKGFQVLCHNCNMAKGFYGQCPHLNYVASYETGGIASISEVI